MNAELLARGSPSRYSDRLCDEQNPCREQSAVHDPKEFLAWKPAVEYAAGEHAEADARE